MEVNLKELANFLVKAKLSSYAGGGKEAKPQRPGFKELEFTEKDWNYRDSYCGFFFAPGQEVVRLYGKPIWVMSYSGGMNKKYHKNKKLTLEVFGFLKKAISLMSPSSPFRGTKSFRSGDFQYSNKTKGNIKDFIGEEKIFYKNKEVFKQDYIGGLMVHENSE